MDHPKEQTLGSYLKEFRKEIAAYLEARMELARLSAYEKTAHLASAFLFFIVIALLVSGVLIFLSIALALLLGEKLESNWLGFSAVAGIYFLLMLIMYFFRKNIIEAVHSATLEILMKSDPDKSEGNDDSAF